MGNLKSNLIRVENYLYHCQELLDIARTLALEHIFLYENDLNWIYLARNSIVFEIANRLYDLFVDKGERDTLSFEKIFKQINVEERSYELKRKITKKDIGELMANLKEKAKPFASAFKHIYEIETKSEKDSYDHVVGSKTIFSTIEELIDGGRTLCKMINFLEGYSDKAIFYVSIDSSIYNEKIKSDLSLLKKKD